MATIKNIVTSKKFFIFVLIVLLIVVGLTTAFTLTRRSRMRRIALIGTWFNSPQSHVDWQIDGGEYCGDALMLIPSSGFIGVGWNDGAPPMYQHTGLDIFSPDGDDNITPIYAAYDGYLTREENWRSAVIIRHPNDPQLEPLTNGEQIWTYYTHMASRDGNEIYISPDFPQGTREKFVEAGTLLGYQGTWSGDPNRRMGLHLHFSIAKSNPDGSYTNETQIGNTLNPLPFLGLEMRDDGIIVCPES